jgi:signal transduction histidine kinase
MASLSALRSTSPSKVAKVPKFRLESQDAFPDACSQAIAGDVAAIARIDAVPKILEVVSRTTGMRFAAVARVTEDRWVACRVRDELEFGLEAGGELDVETTICNDIRASGRIVAIDDVSADQAYCRHPTPAMYGFQSYISVPIRRANGDFFGTLCALDPRPTKLNTPHTIAMFQLFADLIGLHLDAQDRLATSEAALLSEREISELREQFIAVLGHDLRNPLASINSGAQLLDKMPLNDKGRFIVDGIRNSVRRMIGLIDNLLDLARGRLGGGLTLQRSTDEPLAPILEHVIDELRAAWPDRTIDAEISVDAPVACDRARIAQLLSNLLANALMHGAKEEPIVVRASVRSDVFELLVANFGDPISPGVMDRLFQPFFRGSRNSGQPGLGLGLYIASEIAHAHGGTLDVVSTADETRFTFRMAADAEAIAAPEEAASSTN